MTDQKMREASNLVLQWDWDELRKSPNHVDWAEALQNIDDLAHALASAQQVAEHQCASYPDAVEMAKKLPEGSIITIVGEASAQPEGPELTEEELIEKVTKAILFQDSGSTEDWEANSDLGEAAIAAYREADRALLAAPSPAPEGHYTPSGRAAPDQREKVELTDAEIADIVRSRCGFSVDAEVLSDFRAVIAAHEAKQKGGAA